MKTMSGAKQLTGYLHPAYAQSLAEFGTPRGLLRSGGWVLQRQIPGFEDCDAMGCYPLFACQEWSQLSQDLAALTKELVSLLVIVDPFGSYDLDMLHGCFPDLLFPYKEHYVVDLLKQAWDRLPEGHRRNIQKAQRAAIIETSTTPQVWADNWVKLYGNLIKHHAIHGLTAFSESSLRRQLIVPGIVAFRAVAEGSTVAMLLWYVQGQVAYYHLGASSEAGYQMRASFALFWHALEYLATRVRWLDLGGGAGIDSRYESGLARFKKGWATGTRTVYLGGRIFNPVRYGALVQARGIPHGNYFPLYRAGEFQ